MITLSICIPTLNRGAFIGETLKSIVSQATDLVEIVIVDGGSTDNTVETVRQCQGSFPRIRYFRPEPSDAGAKTAKPSNLGFSQDCCRAVEAAQGEYCWLMCDDDILKPGAIQAVLDGIQRKDYSLVIVNAEVRNNDLSRLLEKKRLRFEEDKVYTPQEHEKLFIDTARYLSFMGCAVIKKRLWQEREKEKYFGTGFVHVAVVFQRTLPSDTLVIAQPYIAIRYSNAEWTARAFDMWLLKWPQTIWSFSNFSDKTKARIVPKEPYLGYLTLLTFRARGQYSMDEYSRFITPRLKSGWKRFVLKAIALFPGCLLNFLAVLYCSLFCRTSRLSLTDMKNSPFYWMKCLKGACR